MYLYLQALSFLLHHKLSMTTYNAIKSVSDACGAKFLPNYGDVWREKETTRPSPDSYSIGETEAIISMVPLAIHTFERIFDIPEVAKEISEAKDASENDVVTAECLIKGGTDT